jgi:hypothetical protein
MANTFVDFENPLAAGFGYHKEDRDNRRQDNSGDDAYTKGSRLNKSKRERRNKSNHTPLWWDRD